MKLTQELLKKHLIYNCLTGLWKWRTPEKNRPSGILGYPDSKGYIRFMIFGRTYSSHRLAWFYVYGEWPKGELDHKDGNPKNNRIRNLRLADRHTNMANQKIRCDNTTGYKGVSKWLDRKRNKLYYQAKITYAGKSIFLGSFPTPKLAHKVYRKAARRLNKEFARFN